MRDEALGGHQMRNVYTLGGGERGARFVLIVIVGGYSHLDI